MTKFAKAKNIDNAPKILSEAMQGIQKSVDNIASTGKKALQATGNFIIDFTAMLKEGTKALLKRIQLYFAKLKDKVIEQFIKFVVIRNGKKVTLFFSTIPEAKLIGLLLEAGYKGAKKAVQAIFKKVTGLEFLEDVGESGEKVYAIVYKGVKLEDGNFEIVEKLVKEVFDSKNYTKYLDEVLEITLKRRTALTKFASKFDIHLKNHISGDVISEPIKLGFKELILIPRKGGHWLNKFLEIKKITKPKGVSSLEKIANDIPFEAEVVIKSLLGEKFPKKALSSMFPKNWNFERIKEEIAWVYENTAAKGKGLIETKNGISSFEGISTSGFKIKIQIKDSKVINAHPKID